MATEKNIKEALVSTNQGSFFSFLVSNQSLCGSDNFFDKRKSQLEGVHILCERLFYLFQTTCQIFIASVRCLIRETPAISMAGNFFISNPL